MSKFIKATKYRGQEVNCLQTKLDGHRVLLSPGKAITRVGTNIWENLITLPQIAEPLLSIPNDFVVDAEIHAPGVFATSVKTMIIAQDPELIVSAFALPLVNGKSGRGLSLQGALRSIHEMGFWTPETEYFPNRVLNEADLVRLKKRAEKAGTEGWIAKSSHLDGWYKIKVTHTVDAVITNWTMSTSTTYYGQIRGIECSLWNGKKLEVICNTGNGLTKEFKTLWEGTEDQLIGQVVELEYDEVAAKGKLKFPRILRFREDKKASECTMEQLKSAA